MSYYRKKPVVIEAVQFLGIVDGRLRFDSLTDWIVSATNKLSTEAGAVYRLNEGCAVNTLEGLYFAAPEDWIILGVKGELYPCKPDIFAATYEPAEPSP